MKGYELRRNSVEIKKSEAKKIKAGITAMQEWGDPELIKFSYNKEELLEELKKHKTIVREINGGYEVEEWWVEENEYNEDGEFLEGSNFLEFSEMSK